MEHPTYRVMYVLSNMQDEINTFFFECRIESMESIIDEALEKIWEDHNQDDSVLDRMIAFSILKLEGQKESEPSKET